MGIRNSPFLLMKVNKRLRRLGKALKRESEILISYISKKMSTLVISDRQIKIERKYKINKKRKMQTN